MTVVSGPFTVRVMVTDVWDQVVLAVTPATTIAEVKREGLSRALRRAGIALEDYIVKFHGAEVFDESVTVVDLGAGPNSPFIVLPLRRQAVR